MENEKRGGNSETTKSDDRLEYKMHACIYNSLDRRWCQLASGYWVGCMRVYSIPLPNEAGSSVLAGSELGLGLLSFAASEQLANNKINGSLAADDSFT